MKYSPTFQLELPSAPKGQPWLKPKKAMFSDSDPCFLARCQEPPWQHALQICAELPQVGFPLPSFPVVRRKDCEFGSFLF